MVYLKYSLKKLISIYISLFFVFSPLQGQSQEIAKLYLKTGDIFEGSIVKMDDDSIIFKEIRESVKLQGQRIPNSMIHKLISSSGEVLIEDSEPREPFLIAVAFSDDKKKYKLKMISESEVMFASLVRLSGDSLLIASNQFEQYIAISLIENIAIKKESHAIRKGAGIGFIFGAVLGGLYVFEFDRSFPSESGASLGDIAGFALIVGIESSVVGTIIGGIVRVVSGKNKIHDMTGWSIEEKRAKIQMIMRK